MLEAPTPPLLLSSLHCSTLICHPLYPPLPIIRLSSSSSSSSSTFPLARIQNSPLFFNLLQLSLPLLQLLCNVKVLSPPSPFSSSLLLFSSLSGLPFHPPTPDSSLPPRPVLFAPVYLHHSTRWFVLKLYVWQLGWFSLFFPWYYFNIGGIAQTCRNTEERQAGGKRKLKYEKPRCIKSNYSIMWRAAVITGPFFGLVPCVTFFFF